jgi:hypothetical protein
VLDIFVEPGSGVPVVKLNVHDGNFNGWINLTTGEALRIATQLIEAASATIGQNRIYSGNGTFSFKMGQPLNGGSPFTQAVIPLENLLPKRKRPAQKRRRVPRLDVAAAGGVDDVPGGVGQTRQGNSGTIEGGRP